MVVSLCNNLFTTFNNLPYRIVVVLVGSTSSISKNKK